MEVEVEVAVVVEVPWLNMLEVAAEEEKEEHRIPSMVLEPVPSSVVVAGEEHRIPSLGAVVEEEEEQSIPSLGALVEEEKSIPSLEVLAVEEMSIPSLGVEVPLGVVAGEQVLSWVGMEQA